MNEYPCPVCGKLVKIPPSRERRAKKTSERRLGEPVFFCSREHRTTWRRRHSLLQLLPRSDIPEISKLVIRAVAKHYDWDHIKAADVCVMHPNHLRAIMRGERARFLSKQTVERLRRGLALDLKSITTAIPQLLEERRRAIALQNSRSMAKRDIVKMRMTKTGKPNLKNREHGLKRWASIKQNPTRYLQERAKVEPALRKGRNLAPTDRIKKAWHIMITRYHPDPSPIDIERFINRWSGRLGLDPELIRLHVDRLRGQPQSGREPDLNVYLHVRTVKQTASHLLNFA